MVWLTFQTLAAKAVNVVGQILLAWLLSPKDFGLVGLAYTITAFTSLIQQAGLTEILVQRHRHFRRWSGSAFWLSILLSTLTGAATMAAAPFAAKIYNAPQLIGVIFYLAIAAPLGALSVVPTAKLQADLRFRSLALVNFGTVTGTMILSIVLAWMGFGVYSFVIPRPLVAIGQAVVTWGLAHPPIRWSSPPRRWKYLIGDSALVMVAWFFYAITAQGDYITLGLHHSKEVVGIYFFAFNLSLQTISLFTLNLWSVLMPALNKLNADPERQLRGFLRASQLMAAIVVPASLLQAAGARAAMQLFFGAKWQAAVPAVEALSLGMMFSAIGATSGSLMQARGKFATLAWFQVVGSAVFLMLVLPAGWRGGAGAVAIAVATYHLLYGPINFYVGIREIGGTWKQILPVYANSMIPGVMAVGAGYLAMRCIPEFRGENIARLGMLFAIAVPLYLLLVRFGTPAIWSEGHARVMEFLPARFSRKPVGHVSNGA